MPMRVEVTGGGGGGGAGGPAPPPPPPRYGKERPGWVGFFVVGDGLPFVGALRGSVVVVVRGWVGC